MAQNIFLGFDKNQNLYVHNSATFNISDNVDNLQQNLNDGIDCVGYIDVSCHYFNDVFSYVVLNTDFTRSNTITDIIRYGGPDDIHYYVKFVDDVSSNDTWYNIFYWFNPAYARCPPKNMKNELDITDVNKIVNSAYPINGNIVPKIIDLSGVTMSPLYNDSSYSEVVVQQNDMVFLEYEKEIFLKTSDGIERSYYENCLLLRTMQLGIIPTNYFGFVPVVRSILELKGYNYYLTPEQSIQRVLSSDRLIDEYIRYLSFSLTDSPNNVGLISNYMDIQELISNFCSSDVSVGGKVMTRLKEKLISIDEKTTDVSFGSIRQGRHQDVSSNTNIINPSLYGLWYVDNSYNSSLNITRQLLLQAITQGKGVDFTLANIINQDKKYFTFNPGDMITFTFTINPPPLDNTKKANYLKPGWYDFQEILIKPRKYRIFAKMIN